MRAFGRQGLVSTAHLQFCLCSFQVVHARLLIFFPIKEHELEALNLVCPFCHPLQKHLGKLLQPTYRNHHGNRSLSVRLGIYVSCCMSADLSKCRLERVCLWGFQGLPGNLHLWLWWMRGISKTMWELEKRLWRNGECVCESLQLIGSTTCSQAEFIPTADLQYVPFLLELFTHISPVEALPSNLT